MMERQDISALMDDALPDPSGTVDQLLQDQASREVWRRYHIIGDTLREHAVRGATSAAPRTSNVTELPRRRAGTGAVRIGLALAASVAAVVITLSVLTPNAKHGASSATSPVAGAEPSSTSPGPVLVVGPATNDNAIPPAIAVDEFDQRLDDYLVNFNEQRAREGTPGLHPYVHTVGYDAP